MAPLPPPLPLAASWPGPPAQALAALRAAAEAGGAAVVDARAFSDLHLQLGLELDPADLGALLAALAAAGAAVDPAGAAAARARAAAAPGAELGLRLGVSLPAGAGLARDPVPAVPG